MADAPDIFAAVARDMIHDDDDKSTTKAEDWATPAGRVPDGTTGKYSIDFVAVCACAWVAEGSKSKQSPRRIGRPYLSSSHD